MVEHQPSADRLRKEFFSRLKASTVPLVALIAKGAPVDTRQAITLLEQLVSVLEPSRIHLDDNLSDYVCVPLTHLLQKQAQFPDRLIELALKIISILITSGWKHQLSRELCQQLFYFVVICIEPQQDQRTEGTSKTHVSTSERGSKAPSEELLSQALVTLEDLLTTVEAKTLRSLVNEPFFIVSLGHVITLVTNLATTHSSSTVQLRALSALRALCLVVPSEIVLSKFFPGIVSSLSRILTPPLVRSRKAKVLVQTLSLFRSVIVAVLGDIGGTLTSIEATKDTNANETLESTTSNVALAIHYVVPLKSHADSSVRQEIHDMCIVLLDECHQSLQRCSRIFIETALSLSVDLVASNNATGLKDMAVIYPEIGSEIQIIIYDWSSKTTAISSDVGGDKWHQWMGSLLSGMTILRSINLNTPVIVETFSIALRNTVSAALRSSRSRTDMLIEASVAGHISGVQSSSLAAPAEFQPSVLKFHGVDEFCTNLARQWSISTLDARQGLYLANFLALLQSSVGEDRIAACWLALQVIKCHQDELPEVDKFLELSLAEDDGEISIQELGHELYSYAVDMVNEASESSEDDGDWRLTAVLLEVIAVTASSMGEQFRPELIDVLYPITSCLGSENKALQACAVTTLNKLAKSCGYSGVSKLIIDNVDYLLNTAVLHLNALDISPASSRVLVMMVRLCGPTLIPYLVDIVDGIFGALESFHGYPKFVDSLFAVLREIVYQGSRAHATTLLLGPTQSSQIVDKRVAKKHVPTMLAIMRSIKEEIAVHEKSKEEELAALKEDEAEYAAASETDRTRGGVFERRWKEFMIKKEKENSNVTEDNTDKPNALEKTGEDEETKPTLTYNLLQRITLLVQYYLTSDSPQTRGYLLDLVSTVASVLATNEKQFLPLVNDIWPVVLERLWDKEVYVPILACTALTKLCEAAGDFLHTRFKGEWDARLKKWFVDVRNAAGVRGHPQAWDRLAMLSRQDDDSTSSKVASTLRANTMRMARTTASLEALRTWDVAKKLLCAMVRHVRVKEGMLDDIFWLLSQDLRVDGEVKETLEEGNPDMAWLVQHLYELETLPVPISTRRWAIEDENDNEDEENDNMGEIPMTLREFILNHC